MVKRQGDGAGLHPVKAKAAQTGGGQQQARPALAQRLEGRHMALIERLDAQHEHMGAAGLDDDRAACTHFAKGALDRDLSSSSLYVENVLDFSHATPD